MNVSFIDADRSNIETIVNFMREYYAYDHIPYDREAARSSLERLVDDRSLGRVWVIRYGEEPVGYCVLTLSYSLEFRGRSAFIDELFIREGYRGKGIGTRALQFLKDTARALGVTALRLEVERKNVDAKRLYRKAEFEDQARSLMTNKIAKLKYFA
ncbi:MAG: GNAT family N-acetyltransferase [Nitrospirota bacterium]